MLPAGTVDALTFLNDKLNQLIRENAIHVRRGFRLQEVETPFIVTHLLEETVELQEQVFFGNYDGEVEEASDVFATFLHLLHRRQIPLGVVCQRALHKLDQAFTNDPAKVTATQIGLTRRHRGEYPNGDQTPPATADAADRPRGAEGGA